MELVVARLLMITKEGIGGLGDGAKEEVIEIEDPAVSATNKGISKTGHDMTINQTRIQNKSCNCSANFSYTTLLSIRVSK